MDAHRHTAIELHQQKSHEPQRRHGPTDRAVDPWLLRGRRRWGWSRGVGLLGLIGLLGLLGWGTALPPAQDLHQQPSQPPQALEPSPPLTQPGPYGRLPLSFEANQGQTDQRVSFLARGSGYALFLTGNEAVLALKKPGGKVAQGSHFNPAVLPVRKSVAAGFRVFKAATLPRLFPASAAELNTNSALPTSEAPASNPEPEAPAVLRMRLVGTNATAKVTGLEELSGKSNYFIGNDPKKWHTNVPTYARVKDANVYPGVDLVYYGNQGQLEYDFVVQPGADPRQIALQIIAPAASRPNAAETEALHIDSNGDLVVQAGGGEVRFHKPVVYQPTTNDERRTTNGGDRHLVEGQYVLRGDNRIAFQLAHYDRRRPVVIDPTLVYSSYLGGSGDDLGSAIAVDAAGNAYVTGQTQSADFPTSSGAFQAAPPGFENVFVSKLNAAGSALVYSTYLGGTQSVAEAGGGIAVDAAGHAYVTGFTGAPDFPTTPGAFQTTLSGDSDAFVSKLNAAGSALVYSTYLGGGGGNAIAVDAAGHAYVTGETLSADFPTTPSAFQPTPGGGFGRVQDAFVSKLNATGSALVYSTYLGGNDIDNGTGIAVNAAGNAYVAGYSFSANFPTTPGAFQTAFGGVADVFVAKIAAPTFAGTPGTAHCHGQSVSALTRQFGSLRAAASALGFPSVQALQDAIREFCEE